MSRWSRMSFVFATLLIGALACTETVAAPSAGARAAPNGSAEQSQVGADIALWPTGDASGAADANAIEHALSALPAGGAIRLASGKFYVNRPVVASVGFSGSLVGAGKDATSIIGVGSAAAPFPNVTMMTPGDFWPSESSSLFFFSRPAGDLRISDLTMSLVPGFATAPSSYGFTDLTGFVFVQLTPEGSNTSFANLRLEGVVSTGLGDPFPGLDYQPLWGIGVMGSPNEFPILSSGGRQSLTNSDIGRIGIQATAYQLLRRAQVDISGNVYRNSKQAIVRWLDGSNVSVERNTLDTYSFGSIVVTQEDIPIPGDLSNVVIRNNNITVKGYTGIEIGFIPQPSRPDFNLLIEQNTITQAGPDPIGFFPNLAGIAMMDGQDHAMVRNNVLRGSALFAIIAEGVNNSVFLGNNLQGFAPTYAGVALFGSNNNAVVGIGQGTVWDFGSGNSITGLTRTSGDPSLGDLLRDGQQRRLEILRAVYHPPKPVKPVPPPDSSPVSIPPAEE